MHLFNPSFDEIQKLLHFGYDFLGLSFRSHIGIVIINDISLAPASVKIISIRLGWLTNGDSHALKRSLVVCGTSAHAIASTKDCHLRSLQGRIVGSGKTPVG